jgi:glycerol-3-phosphate dehydrogenase subunit C
MAKTFKVTIDRFQNEKIPTSFVQTYEITYFPSQTVLEVLAEIQNRLDDTLAFRSSCEAGKCGSCAVQINGNPVLACRTLVDGNDLHIGPLPGFPVTRDLIVDRERYELGFVQNLTYESTPGKGPQPAAALPEHEIDYGNLARCIGCLVCNAACPVTGEMDDSFPSPAVIAEVLSSGVRIDKQGKRQAPIESNIDFCSLCLNCHVSCPSGVSLNRINAQAKDAYVQQRGRSLRDWMLGRAELMGKLGGILPSVSNKMLANPLVRSGMERALNISQKAEMVPYSQPFRKWLKRRMTKASKEIAGRKVVYFVGCYTNYNDTDPGKEAVTVLEHLGLDVQVPDQKCCGLPLISSGDMNAARKLGHENIAKLKVWCDRGYDILTSCTSCSMMLKYEYAEVLKLNHASDIALHTYDIGEYLRGLWESGEFEFDLIPVPLKAAYHTPCHLRTQKIGLPLVEILMKIPDLKINVLDASCCGQSGSYGFKVEKQQVSTDVGRHLADSLTELKPDVALSECGPCQIRMHGESGLPVAHPISILRRALNLPEP